MQELPSLATTWLDLRNIVLSEINQTQRGIKCRVISLVSGIWGDQCHGSRTGSSGCQGPGVEMRREGRVGEGAAGEVVAEGELSKGE